MASYRHNLFFDARLPRNQPILLEDGSRLQGIEGLYNSEIFRFSLRGFMCSLLLQYVIAFASVPFDNIENRPPVTILAVMYTLVIFSICACLLPMSTSVVPTMTTKVCQMITSILEFLGVALNVASVVFCLNVDVMYSKETDSTGKVIKVEITSYVQVMACLLLVSTAVAFAFSFLNSLITIRGLSNLRNRNDRRSKNDPEFEMVTVLPPHIATKIENLYNS